MTLENCFLFSRNTNYNNMRTKNCNNIDKGINNKMIIPSNSRPLTNNTVTTNCSILSQPGQVQPEQGGAEEAVQAGHGQDPAHRHVRLGRARRPWQRRGHT